MGLSESMMVLLDEIVGREESVLLRVVLLILEDVAWMVV
jgi:hypothetical protein